MKTFKIFALLLVVALFLTACQGEDPMQIADPDNTEIAMKKDDKQLPFRADFTSDLTVGPIPSNSCPTPDYGGAFVFLARQLGSGNGIHMGSIGVLIKSCLEVGGGLIAVRNVEFRIAAANGDSLFVYLDVALPTSPSTGEGDFIIDGGTGRFSNAEGKGKGRYQIVPDGPDLNSLEGWIRY